VTDNFGETGTASTRLRSTHFGSLCRWGEMLESYAGRVVNLLDRRRYFFLALFCLGYGLATVYRASMKLFWFDELFTVYLSRLPELSALWRALLQGTDFNPPLFYLFTQISERSFGAGEIGARVPEILGFGIFCLCLFRFVSLRSSALGGAVSMLFPLTTGAYWYAFEARPHGIVLGFGGLALVCWQGAAAREKHRLGWLLGLGAALIGGLSMHAFAVLLFVPITIGELARSLIRRRMDWPLWATIAISTLGMLPLMLMSRTGAIATFISYKPRLASVPSTYTTDLAPATLALSAVLVLLSIGQIMPGSRFQGPAQRRNLPAHELAALFACILLPLAEYLLAMVMGTPYFDRYSLFLIAGFAGLLGVAAAARPTTGSAILIVLVLQTAMDFVRYAQNPFVLEPSTNLPLSTQKAQFMERYAWISANSGPETSIILTDNLEFLPTLYYAPPALASRLVYLIQSERDFNGVGYVKLKSCCNVPGKAFQRQDFLSKQRSFLVYGRSASIQDLNPFQAGAAMTFKGVSADHYLVSVDRSTPTER
jgi:hypothetical protein